MHWKHPPAERRRAKTWHGRTAGGGLTESLSSRCIGDIGMQGAPTKNRGVAPLRARCVNMPPSNAIGNKSQLRAEERSPMYSERLMPKIKHTTAFRTD